MHRRTFLTRLAIAVAGAGLTGVASTAQASTTYYVSYTYYRQNRATGVVTRVSSGSTGPFFTRREAQSTVDWYNSQDSISGNYRYYYSARVQ